VPVVAIDQESAHTVYFCGYVADQRCTMAGARFQAADGRSAGRNAIRRDGTRHQPQTVIDNRQSVAAGRWFSRHIIFEIFFGE
jgi:hypothetical protein